MKNPLWKILSKTKNETEPARPTYYDLIDNAVAESFNPVWLLEDMDPWRQKVIRILHENQRLYQNLGTANEHDYLPIVDEVWKRVRIFDWISVYPMLGPLSVPPSGQEIVAKARKLKTRWANYTSVSSVLHSQQEIIDSLVKEIEMEVLTDLRNNVGTLAKIEKAKMHEHSLYANICEVSGYIYKKICRIRPEKGADWIVAPKGLLEQKDIPTSLKYHEAPEGFPEHTILIGAKSTEKEGYFYHPYIPFCDSPKINDPDFNPIPGIITRFGKNLTQQGPKFFARIVLE